MKLQLILLSLLFLSCFACRKPKDPDGIVNVLLCHTPCEYQELNIDISGYDVHYTDAGAGKWVEVNGIQGEQNMLSYSSGPGTQVASGVQMAPGKIDQLRIRLGSNHSMKTKDGSTQALLISHDVAGGVLIPASADVRAGMTLELQVNVTPDKSVEQSENTWYLKPVMELTRIGYE
jgi:hypothetical protein